MGEVAKQTPSQSSNRATAGIGSSSYSLNSSKSSRDTLDDEGKYNDILFVIQEEPATVILPVDATDHSEHCLNFYIRYIHKIGNMVHVLYITEDIIGKSPEEDKNSETKGCCGYTSKKSKPKVVREVGPSPGVLKELEMEMKTKYHTFKRKVKKYFRTNGVRFEFHRLISNDPAKAISLFTKQQEATMIVMGSRNRGAFRSTFMGSVSKKVISLADVPVLVVQSSLTSKFPSTTVIY